MQVLLFTAAWLLCDRRTLRHRRTAFTAGLVRSACCRRSTSTASRSSWVCRSSACSLWLRAERSDRKRVGLARSCAPGVGVAVGASLGFLDLVLRSPLYLRTLRSDLERLAFGAVFAILVAVALVGVVALVVSPRRRPAAPRSGRLQPPAALVAGGVVLLGGFGAWIARPHLQTVRGAPNIVVKAVQIRTHLPVDPTRRYFEHSVQWAAGTSGRSRSRSRSSAPRTRRCAFVQGSLRVPSQVAALVLGPPALLYLWKPSITPDQIWVDAAVPAGRVPGARARRVRRAVRARGPERTSVGAGVRRGRRARARGAARSRIPCTRSGTSRRMTNQRGFPPAVQDACRIVGKSGAIVVPQEASPLTWLYDPQTLRSFCDVPVAIMLSGQRSALSTRLPGGSSTRGCCGLADEWAQQDRQLYLVAGNAQTIRKLFPGARCASFASGQSPPARADAREPTGRVLDGTSLVTPIRGFRHHDAERHRYDDVGPR